MEEDRRPGSIPKRRIDDAATSEKRRREYVAVLTHSGRAPGHASSPHGKSISRSGDTSGEEEGAPLYDAQTREVDFTELRAENDQSDKKRAT